MNTWPWPNDSREDRARRVAISYRRLIELVLAGETYDLATALEQLDVRWQELGQGWLKPADTPLLEDDWLTPRELAELLHIDSRSISHWARRGHIRAVDRNGTRLYRVGDIVAYSTRRGKRRR